MGFAAPETRNLYEVIVGVPAVLDRLARLTPGQGSAERL
jgi:hypothetical protein